MVCIFLCIGDVGVGSDGGCDDGSVVGGDGSGRALRKHTASSFPSRHYSFIALSLSLPAFSSFPSAQFRLLSRYHISSLHNNNKQT